MPPHPDHFTPEQFGLAVRSFVFGALFAVLVTAMLQQ